MELKKYKVTIEIDTFSYTHIDGANESDAIRQGTALIKNRFPWAKITSIHAKRILGSRFQVFVKIAPFVYEDIQEETEDDAIEYVENILSTKYPWLKIISIKVQEAL